MDYLVVVIVQEGYKKQFHVCLMSQNRMVDYIFLSGVLIPRIRVRVVTHNSRKLPFVGVLLRCGHTKMIYAVYVPTPPFASDACRFRSQMVVK